MDFLIPTGTPIRAAGRMMAQSQVQHGGYNNMSRSTGSRLATLYGHCSKLLAKVGQTVEAGGASPSPAAPGAPPVRTSISEQRVSGADRSKGISAEGWKGRK